MKTKSYIKISKAVIATTILIATIAITKYLFGEAKSIYRSEEHYQALSCILDFLQ